VVYLHLVILNSSKCALVSWLTLMDNSHQKVLVCHFCEGFLHCNVFKKSYSLEWILQGKWHVNADKPINSIFWARLLWLLGIRYLLKCLKHATVSLILCISCPALIITLVWNLSRRIFYWHHYKNHGTLGLILRIDWQVEKDRSRDHLGETYKRIPPNTSSPTSALNKFAKCNWKENACSSFCCFTQISSNFSQVVFTSYANKLEK